MNSILITDTHTPLGFALCKGFLQAGLAVVAAPSSEQEKGSHDNLKKKNLLVVNWNRTSPISAKNVLLHAVQKLNSLDAALILETPLPQPAAFVELKYLEIERVIDTWMKGSLYLARELVCHFSSRKEGALAFVNLSPPKAHTGLLLDDLCREGMRHVFENLVRETKKSNVYINSFISRSEDVKAYAEFVVRTMIEKCNKARGKLFSFKWK